MGKKLRILLVFAALLAAPGAEAQTVKVNLRPEAQQVANQLQIDLAGLETLAGTQLKALFGLADVDTFLRLSANAQSMANKGLGADYATPFEHLVIGLGANISADAGDADLATLQSAALGEFDRAVPVAAGVQLSAMAGFQLSDGLFVYVNGLAYPVSSGNLKGSGYNVGAHVQYRILSGLGTKLVAEWGGIAITSGLELSRATLKLEDSLSAPVPLAEGFDMQTETTGTLELTQRALTIPVEVSTSLQLFYFLSLYGGVGVDFQLGGAETTLNITSTMTARGAGAEIPLGTATLDYSGAQDPNAVLVRFLGGVQANVGPIHAFAQLNLAAEDLTLGVAVGARFAY